MPPMDVSPVTLIELISQYLLAIKALQLLRSAICRIIARTIAKKAVKLAVLSSNKKSFEAHKKALCKSRRKAIKIFLKQFAFDCF